MGEACQFESNLHPPVTSVLRAYFGEPTLYPWYALKVRVGSEAAVVQVLESRGFHSYCPKQKERRRYSDRMKVVEKPMFPGYIFCSFDVDRKLPVISSPGVDYIVGFAGTPSVIPDSQIEGIRKMVSAGATACECFAAGDRIRVTVGPLQGIEGILVQEPRGSRLVVSVDLLNRATSLYIDKDQTSIVRISNSGR